VVKVLDKGTVEETLGRLQKTVEKRLSLDKVRKVITKNDFDKLDDWLKTKLSEFLDDTLNLKRLDQVRKTITLFLSKRKEFYKKAVKALNRQYEFNFAYAYQSSTRQTALFDIHFDFAQGDQVIGLLKAALNGDFDKVMVKQVKGVTLNLATLTHQLQRQSHVEVSLPFSKKSAKHINTALAKANVIEEEDGRVLVYELDAKNKVDSIVRGKMVRDSSLAVGGTWKTRLGNAVRQHNTESISYSYSFRQARRKMKSADLQYQLKPYVETYFPSSFSTGTSGAQSFDTWIALLDRFIDEAQDNGEDIFGDTLISLEVSLPGGLASAWLKAPKKDSSLYRTMSRKIQEALKQLIPFYYFQDPAKYKDLAAAAPLLLYSSIPAANSLQIRGSLATLNKGKSLYWNWPDPKQRNIMANLPTTLASLNLAVRRAFDVLVSRPELAKTQEFYRGEQACKRILETSLHTTQGRTNLERLLRAESVIVKSAHKAGSELAKFRKNQSRQPTKAIESLAKFGSSLTEAFNKKFTSIYGKGSLRPLSTLVFSEAARALDPSLGKEKPQAMLALSVLKEGAAFTLADFENNQMPEKEDLVVEERLVNLG